jgi:phenylpropionate dioxygenase-like ring-hydroxylating dioxygenase large terminal subunit
MMEQSLQIKILKELLQQLDEGKNIDAGVQYKMPTTSYVCPEIAAKEFASFFQGHPQMIGLSGELPEPGSFLTLDDFGTPILATRDKDGRYHAFLNACRHRSARVASETRGKKSMFTCPFHHWGYGNNGNLISIPNEDHFGPIDKSCNGLIQLPAIEKDGLLWVHPKPDGHLDIDELLSGLSGEIASHSLGNMVYGGEKIIDMKLNWKLANDTFGETYHFQKLHKNTLGQIFLGNNLHLTEFGRHHRFVTANRAIHDMRSLPEDEWSISDATFVLYYLFPNIQLVVNNDSVTLIRIYPDENNPGRSITRISFYYSAEAVLKMEAEDQAEFDPRDAYSTDRRKNANPSLAASLEVFRSTIEMEDYVMGEMQQRSAQNGLLKEIIFGRNEPALHHFHNSYREALNQPPLVAVIPSEIK